MKKYISQIALSLVAVFASCTNEEISISKTVNFTVNPSTVISSFSVIEENAGELEGFNTECKLNVELFIYNNQGKLVQKFKNTYSNYAVQMKASAFLDHGDYTAVAISHIDSPSNDVYFWRIEGEENLEGMRIVDNGYIGGQNKVLGVAVKNFNVGDEVVDMNINIQPSGSMLVIRYYNYLALKNQGYTVFSLMGNKTMEYLEFDRSGGTNVVADNHNGQFDWIFDTIDASEFKDGYTYIYSYEYVLPMSNVGLQFYTEDESMYHALGSVTYFNTQAGGCYYAYLSLNSDVSKIQTIFGRANSSSARESHEDSLGKTISNHSSGKSIFAGQTLYVKSLKH